MDYLETNLMYMRNHIAKKKISLWQASWRRDNHQFYGFGIKPGILSYQIEGLGNSHVFYAATGASTS